MNAHQNNKLTIITACDAPRGVLFEKDYQSATIRLARSLRRLGGPLAKSPIICVFNRTLDSQVIQQLKSLDVELRYVDIPKPNHPNSMMIAAGAQDFSTDYGLVMDSDVMFLGDPSELFSPPSDVRAAPSTHGHHRWVTDDDADNWHRLISHLGINVDTTRRLTTHVDGANGRFYLSAGAILFRRSSGFAQTWVDFAYRIFDGCDSGALPPACAWAPTETGLSLAVLASPHLSFEMLPERLHTVYHCRGYKLIDDARLVHYCDNRVAEVPSDLWDVHRGVVTGS